MGASAGWLCLMCVLYILYVQCIRRSAPSSVQVYLLELLHLGRRTHHQEPKSKGVRYMHAHTLSLSLSLSLTHTHTHTHYSPCVLLEIVFQLFYFKITRAVKELKSNHRLILTGTPIQVSVYGHEQMQLQDLVIESLGISSFALHCRITL